MARRPELTDIFTRTQAVTRPDENATGVPAMGRTVSTSVGLKESEVVGIEVIASEHGVARNAVMRYAIRYFLNAYSRGLVKIDVELPLPQKKKLRMR